MISPFEAVAALAQHCWKGAHWAKTAQGMVCVKEPLKRQHIEHHLNGGPALGLAPIVPGTSETRIAVLDFDDHAKAMEWSDMVSAARIVARELRTRGLEPFAVRSSGGSGIHLYLLWDKPQDAASVRIILADVLNNCELQPGVKGLEHGQVEIFPKQDSVPEDGFGNMFVLPFSGESTLLDLETGEDLDEYELPDVWPTSNAVPLLKREASSPPERRSEVNAPELSKLREALERLPNEDLDYDEWRNIIFAIHDATGGSDEGLELATAWSAKSSKHDATFLTERVWPYIKNERGGPVITAERIFRELEKHGSTEHVVNELGVSEVPPSRSEPTTQPTVSNVKYPARTPSEHIALTGKLRWHIDGVLPRLDLVTLIGASGAGKSFVALDMAVSIARGAPWRDQECAQSPVAIVVAEGRHGFAQRLRAAGVTDEDPIDIYPHTPNLLEKSDAIELNNSMIKTAQQRNFTQPKPLPDKPDNRVYGYGLIIVDTLAATTAGANENSGEDMGKVLRHCQLIAEAQHATVLLVHHLGKDETKGARGWSGIKGAADCQLIVSRAEHLRNLTVEKMKDGKEGDVYEFTLQTVDLGDGASSCVVNHQHVGRTTQPTRYSPKPGTYKHRVWTAAAALLALGDATYDDVIEEVGKQFEAERGEPPKNWRGDTGKALDALIAERHLACVGGAISWGRQ